jgi:YegS/Rv2252/BmrU family lipid kinase
MPLPLVIVNPESGSGATRDAWPTIASDLRTHFGAFRIAFTNKSGDATDLAAEAARKGARLIVACGGDGTISEVANGILNSGKDVELGILPRGTGGDFRRTLAIPLRTRSAARILREGKTRVIDVGRVTFINHEGEEDKRYLLGVASFGMSAAVIDRVREGGSEWLPVQAPKWLKGRISYGASMLQTALKSPTTRVVVQLDERTEQHLTVANLCIANARYFGGGMKIAPDAKLTDGQFDVITIGDLGSLKILTNAPRIYLGSHLSMDQVHHALARKITARPANKNSQVAIEIDGELSGHLPATFQIVPRALRVRCPAR